MLSRPRQINTLEEVYSLIPIEGYSSIPIEGLYDDDVFARRLHVRTIEVKRLNCEGLVTNGSMKLLFQVHI